MLNLRQQFPLCMLLLTLGTTVPATAQMHSNTTLVAGEHSDSFAPVLIRAASLQRLPGDAEEIVPLVQPEVVQVWNLADLEAMAAANNPAIASAQARVDSANGNWLQVGLKPNPVVGYIGDDIGAGGGAGAQGLYIQQQFVRGQKLELNRNVAAAQVAQAEAKWSEASTRVMTDVRLQFYRTLLAQRRLEMTHELSRVSEQAADAAKRLMEIREGRRVDYLRAKIEADRLDIKVQEANASHIASWRALASVVGLPNITRRRLQGDLDDDLPQFDYDVVTNVLLTESPQIAAAQADAEQAAWAIDRAHAQVVPDLQTQLEVKQETTANETLVVVQAGFSLPLWNRNQGGIQAAYANHSAAVAKISQLELQLRRALAAEFQVYETARIRALRYARDILPNTRTTVELAQAGVDAGELTYLDVLTARRALFGANLEYLDALEAVWVSAQRIEGMLLSDSLSAN